MQAYVKELRLAASHVPISSEPKPLGHGLELMDVAATRVGDTLIWKQYDDVVGLIASLPSRDERKILVQYARAVASHGRVRSTGADARDRSNVARLPRLIGRVKSILESYGPSRTSGELGFAFWLDHAGRIRFIAFASISVAVESM